MNISKTDLIISKIICSISTLFVFVFLPDDLHSQIPTDKDYTIRVVSDRIENDLALGLISIDQAQTTLSNLEHLIDNPIDINTATKEDMSEIPILSDFQINQFIKYRTDIGGTFTNIYDIKSIPSWDEETILWIHPLLCISKKQQKDNSLYNTVYGSKKNISMTYLYDNIQRDSSIIGSPLALTLKTSISNKNIFDFSMSVQKDKGEPFGKTISSLMDSYNMSIGIYGIKNMKLFLGDYRTSWGSGLIMSQNFNIKTYSSSANINSNKGISTVKGASETNFSRGLAAEFCIRNTKLSIISSIQNMDGRVSEDSIITSFIQTGLHLTKNDMEKKSTVRMRMIGGNMSFRIKDLDLILSGIYYDWNKFRLRTPKGTSSIEELNNIDKMTNYSFSYIYHPTVRKVILRGETATNKNLGFATIHNLQYKNTRIGEMTLNIRYASPTFWSYYSSSQYYLSNNINNQWGYSIEYKPPIKIPNTDISLVYDRNCTIRHIQRKLANNESQTFYADITSKILKNTTVNSSLLYNNRYENGRRIRYKLKAIYDRNGIEYLANIDFNATKRHFESDYSFGKMITLGLNLNKNTNMKLKTRLSLFDTDSFHNRIFHYYPHVTGDYSPTFINGKGCRFSIFGVSEIATKIKLEANLSIEKKIDSNPNLYIGMSLIYRG